MENYSQAPLPHHVSLEGISSHLQIVSLSAQDIREIQREKTVAYAHALQYWVEKTDLPTGGQTMPVGQKCEGVMGEDELLPLLLGQRGS